VCALIACNLWLWNKWLEDRSLETKLENSERIIEDQKRQTRSLAERINLLSQDVERVKNFDSKLRLMMNMEKDTGETEASGEFARSYLPLHRQELAARKMQDFVDNLSREARLEEVRQQDLLRVMRSTRNVLFSTPSVWPVNGFVSSSFGARLSPFGGGGQFHKGLDIAARPGSPIIAPADGTVEKAGADGAYGISVDLDHGGGINTKFAHMQRVAVKPGQWVRRGEILGYVGMTGRATGPHLHYEVRLNGVPVNPMRYILE
nr:M23 family metallopeptidase [Desulfovibrio sp.]